MTQIDGKELMTILHDMQTASDNCVEYEKMGLQKNADYQRAYLHGMIRTINVLGFYVATDTDGKLSIFEEDEK